MLCNDNIPGSCWSVQPKISLENDKRGLEYKLHLYEQKHKINSWKKPHYKVKN